MDFWAKNINLELDKQYRAQIGPLVLWINRQFDEIHIAAQRNISNAGDNQSLRFETDPDNSTKGNLELKRWVVGENSNEIVFLPAMPDRPVVVRPEVPLKIPQGMKAVFFVSIPLWAQISVNNSHHFVVCLEPSVILSNIWFGDTVSGELCYSLTSRARRRVIDSDYRPYIAICPVHIKNTTLGTLDIERFCIHVEHLAVYRGQKNLWTNDVDIAFHGEESISRVNYTQKAPEYEPAADILNKPRIPVNNSILKKSIGTFKLLTGF